VIPSRISSGGWQSASRCSLVALLALVGIANLILLLDQSGALVRSLYLDADNASAFVLPALAGHAPAGALVNLGNHAWYEPWWLMRATAGLHGYRQLWEAAPIVLGLLGIAVVAACAWSALGWLAGLLSAVALVAASESLRGVLYVPESHGLIVLHTGVLCGALLIAHRLLCRAVPRLPVLLLVGVPLVAFTGAGLTDQLLYVSGLAPFILAPAWCWLRYGSRPWRAVSLFALVTGALAALLGLLLTHLMQHQHVIHAPFPVDFVGAEAVLVGLQNLLAAFLSLGGGSFFGRPASGAHLLTFLTGALIVLALVAVLASLRRWARATAGSAEPRAAASGSGDLFIAFWALALVLVLAAFALTSFSGSVSNIRYLVGAWVALAALLGTLATTPLARTVVISAVALFGVLNLHADHAGRVPAAGPGPDQQVARAIEHFVTAKGADLGYSGYWDAAPVTWETHLRVKLYPIQSCKPPQGWCHFDGAQISSWYLPHAGRRTFLLTDTRAGVPLEVGQPPASFGAPLASEVVGMGLTVFVYGHDIAADLGP